MSAPGPAYPAMEWTDERVGRYWRWQARFPEQYFTHLFGDRIAGHLRRHVGAGQRVLDLGCGMGFLCRHLADIGAEVWAADASVEAVAATNARNAGVSGFRGAATVAEMRADGRRFDRVVSVEVVEHLDDAGLAAFLDAVRALLEDDGLAVITTPNEEDLRAAETYCPTCDHVFHRWQHLRSWSAASLGAALGAHGLDVVETYATNFARRRWLAPLAGIRRALRGGGGKPANLVCVARRGG